ncbi:hypothetical protein LAZ67_8002480, partial [Cordylochernes scorpioides]
MSRIATNLVWADSPFNAEQMPVRHGQKAHPCAEKSSNFDLQKKSSINLRTIENFANSPAGGKDANSATSSDFEIDTPFNGAIKAQRSWANSSKDVNPASEDGFTIVQGKKRRRGSADSPAAAAHTSNALRSGTNRRQLSSTERVPRAQEIKTTRTHIVEARARQASSTEEQCLYVEHCPELELYHFLKAIDEMVGGTSDVVQVTKMNGLCLLGLANKALAERLINEGLKVDGMLLKTFPFYRRAAKLTIGNLPFFVKDASVIDALLPYGRVTSIIPKQLKAGRYVYTDGRREACIVPHDGINIESIPARLDIKIKGEAWPIYLTSGIRCSRCRGQGHRRANCPLLTGQSITSRRASLPSTTNLPPSTAPGLPGQSSAAPTAPAPTSPAVRLSGAQPDARAASPPSTAPRPSTSAPPASSVQVAAPVPPSVAPPVDPASRRLRPGRTSLPQRSPELEPYHYMRAIDRMFGSTREVFQVTKMNGHFLVGLANRGMAERLINEGLEVDGTLHRGFPFRKRAERITVGNLPFFVGDAAVISALSSFGRVTSIAPKLMKAGPYIYNDGRREAFIILREGMTIERLPTRLDITIKGEAWPAYLFSGIRCSRCRGQGHRRANCPLLARRTTAPGPATPTSPTSVPLATAPRLPQQPSAQPPPPASPSPTMEVSDVPPTSRAALHPPAALRQSPPAPSALPAEDAPPAPPPVTPAPSLRTPGSREPAAPIPDVEMSIVEETSASFTSKRPSRCVHREAPQRCDALAGLIRQILDLRPGAASNLYKVLGQVKAELRTTPAVPPTPPLPAPRPAETAPPAPQGEESAPAEVAYPPPLPVNMTDEARKKWLLDLFKELNYKTFLATLLGWTTPDQIIHAALHSGEKRNDILKAHPNQRSILANFLGSVIERARGGDQSTLDQLSDFSQDANSAEPVDLSLAAIPTSNAAAQVRRNWADITEEVNPGAKEGFTLVQGRKRRRGSADSPTAAAPSSNPGGSRTIRRPQPSVRSVPRAQEIPTTRAHITEARARQASSAEEHCVYLEHGPELQPFHYLKALDRLLGGTAGVVQVSKVNDHQLLGLANRGLAERLINNGLEVEGTLLRAFPFRKRAERITVGNLPFFVEDSAIIKALEPYGRITSIAPKMMKAGPYTYTDGRREVFIVLHEGVTTERLPTRLKITIKGEAWPAYLSSGIKCSRCHGQGHRRANCPLLAGRTTAPGPATPTSPTSVPPATAPRLPQQPSAQPPPPASPSPTMEVSDVPPTSRAALHPPAALRQSPPAPSALPAEDAPPAPPPVTPAPSLRTPGSREPAAQTPDVEMSIAEETSASSTSSAKNATRVDLDAFIEKHPSVSFAGTDALGLGREEVLDLLSSRTKAQRKGPLLSPLQCDALTGLIGQILDLRPGAAINLYKVLGQVKAELRTTPAVPPTPTLPAPWPAKPTPPALHGEKTSPDIATPPLSTEFIDACYDQANDIIYELSRERYSEPLSDIGVTEGDIVEAFIFPEDREPLLRRLSTQKRTTLAGIVSAASERVRSSDPFLATVFTVSTPHVYTWPRVARAPEFFASGGRKVSRMATNMVWAGSPHRAEHEPGRLGSDSQAVAEISAENQIQDENSRIAIASGNYANLAIDRKHANFAAACVADVTPSTSGALTAATNWAEQIEASESGGNGFTEVKHKRRRRDSPGRPVEQRSSGIATSGRTGATPRSRPPAGGGRASRRSRERPPGNENGRPYAGSLSTKALAERLIKDGLDIGHTHLRAFLFKKMAERITVGNLPFFVDDAAVIEALKPYGDVTSIVPIRLRAGRYTFTDGRREAFILLKEGIALEKIPTRVVIRNKGNVLSAFISYGVKCSRCGRQGHRRANCPINPGRASNNGQPQPAPLPPGASSTVSRQQNRPTPAAPALPMEETPSAPPPVTPAPSLQAPEGPVGPRSANSQHPEPPPARPDFVAPRDPLPAQKILGPAAPTPDAEMSIVEETSASSTSSARNATRIDLDAFIERHPSVSFAGTDALGLGREEVLDLLSSRTKAQRNGPLLPPSQCDALAGLIRQILDLRPGAASNLYKVLGQVKAELRTTPDAVPPTPPLPAPRPAEPTPPAPQEKESTPPPPPSAHVEDNPALTHWNMSQSLYHIFMKEPDLGPTFKSGIDQSYLADATLNPREREDLIAQLLPRQRNILAQLLGALLERALDLDPFLRGKISELRAS